MGSFTLGAVLFSLVIVSYQAYAEKTENVMRKRIQKREKAFVDSKQSDFNQFVEEKLIQHTQALEHLVNLLQQNEETTKQLVNTLSRKVAQPIPKLPEKLEAYQTRRSSGESSNKEHPISRQSVAGKTFMPNTQTVSDKPSPWCSVAVLCVRTMETVCGYDDNFGYGKFDDMCHMLQVNCYWKYNFAFVPSCTPIV